jgi:FkbM family methyltransferase
MLMIKTLLASCGLKPLLLGLYSHHRSLASRHKSRFRFAIAGREVTFVTEDLRSKKFFHYRYRSGQLHEPPVSRELVARVKGARVFADIGAHIGYFGCLAGAVEPGLRVYLFEMNHRLIEVIERNLAANRIVDCEIVNRPVADGPKPIAYAADSTDPGRSARPPGESRDGGRQIVVEALALDDFFAERGDLPDVVKIDVQGAEFDVLKGARRILRERHPVLFLEVHPTVLAEFGATVDDVYRLLEEHGYRLHPIAGHRRGDGAISAAGSLGERPDHTHMLLCL